MPAAMQAANHFLRLQGYPQPGYIEIPADTLLDSPQMTVEAWVAVRDARAGGCSSIAGNGWTTGWWLGICGTTMRSYFNGSSTVKDGGAIPDANTWIHIAAVTDGVTRKHYINGNLVLSVAESGTRSVSTKAVRIGSDPDWDYMAQGGLDEVRIWKVARTQEQIRQTMLAPYVAEANDASRLFDGLEAWYQFEGDATDSWRTHHGTVLGTGTAFETGIVIKPVPKHRAVRR
jgi:hypothetical protein